MKAFLFILIVISFIGYFLPLSVRITNKKLKMYGKPKKELSFLEKLFNRLSKEQQSLLIILFRKSGLDNEGLRDDFLRRTLMIFLFVGGGSIVMYLLLHQTFFIFTGVGAVLYVIVRVARLLEDNKTNITMNSQILIRVLNRELSRKEDYAGAFRRAEIEVGEGRLKFVLKKVVKHLEAVRGDIRGAINVLKDHCQHEIIDMLWSALETSLQTSKQEDTLEKLELRVRDKIEEAVIKATNFRRVYVYLNIFLIVGSLFAQVLYVLLGQMKFTLHF